MLQLVGYRKLPVGMSGCHVTKVECLKIIKKAKTVVFDLTVHWSDGKKYNIQRKYTVVFDFVQALKQAFHDIQMPELKAAKSFESLWKAKKEQKKAVEEFFQKILTLPEKIARGKEVCEFFSFPEEGETESRANCVAVFNTSEGEYESIDHESCPYNTLSIKPKSISVFDREQSDDSTSTYWAVTEYSKRKSGEVDLKEGAAVSVLQRELSGWWFVHVEDTNEQGWAPASCLLPVDRNNLNNCKVSGPFGEFKTLNDYEAEQPDEVSCRKGEKVEVIEATLDGWWEVRCKDKVGRIPATNLVPISDEEKLRNSLYHQAGIYKKYSPPPRRNSKVSVEELYGRVDKFRKVPPTKTTASTQDFDGAPEYAEVNFDRNFSLPSCKPKEDVHENPPPVCRKPEEDSEEDPPFYMNAAEDLRHPYVNVELKPNQQPRKHEIKYYKTKTRYAPVVKHKGRPTLPSEIGDIVESHKEEGDQVFAKLFRLATGVCPDPREGWIPKKHLEPYELGPGDALEVEPKTPSHSASSAKSMELGRPSDSVTKQKPVAEAKTRPALQKRSDPGPNQRRLQSRSQPSNGLNERNDPGKAADDVNNGEHLTRSTSVGSAIEPEKVVGAKQNSFSQDASHEQEQFTIRKLSRIECENVLLKSGAQHQFIIRESTKVGHYALSVRSADRIHHFPIELTSEKKYFIGKYNFDSLQDVIQYYKANALFELEDGTGIMLDSSLETF